MDNFCTGHLSNLVIAMLNPAFTFVEHDVEEPFDGDFDQIYHLASPASPPMYQKNPITTAKTNFLGTLNALELADKLGARFLLASTSETYGDPSVHPQVESYNGNVNQTGPRACYDEGKRIAETLAFDFQRVRDVDVRVVRIFNTFGPRMNPADGRVISNFIEQALANREITIYGEGTQTRSFCYFQDLVDGLELAMNAGDLDGPVNLGNPEEVTICELAKLIVELSQSKSRLVSRNLPADDPRQRRPDIGKAKELLGWQPRVSLRDGLGRTIEYHAEGQALASC